MSGTLFDRGNVGDFYDAKIQGKAFSWRVQRFAKGLGWSGRVKTSEMEGYTEAMTLAVSYLNSLCTKDVQFVVTEKSLSLIVKPGYEDAIPEVAHFEKKEEPPQKEEIDEDELKKSIKEVGAAYMDMAAAVEILSERHGTKALMTALINHTGRMFRTLRQSGAICDAHAADFMKAIEVVSGLRPKSDLPDYVTFKGSPGIQGKMNEAFTEAVEEHLGRPL